MTQQEILDFNRRCAEFLGVEYEIHSNTYRYKDQITTELLFHSDWNWIMEVVNKIRDTSNPKSHSDITCGTIKRNIQYHLAIVNKDGAVDKINQFLIWYEQNKTL